MTQSSIKITDADGERHTIAVSGQMSDPESVVEAHGFDPAAVEWRHDDPDADLRDAIQSASDLQELKNALTSDDHPAQARGRGPR